MRVMRSMRLLRSMGRMAPFCAVLALAACKDQLPTSVDERLLPVGPVSIEVRLPWSQFAASAKVYTGFGRAEEMGRGVLANQWGGSLNARTLLDFPRFPTSADIVDSTGTTLPDTLLTYVGGLLTLHFDTIASSNAGVVAIDVNRMIGDHWDPRTATWQLAVDSLDSRVPWTKPGGGPVALMGVVGWDPVADSVQIALDSAEVVAMADTLRSNQDLRVDLEAIGEQVVITRARLTLTVRPSIHRDTLVTLAALNLLDMTFVYDPPPPPPPELRVGGIPAARTVIQLALPKTVTGTPEVCAIVTCPFALTDERVNYAAVVFTSRANPSAFVPVDSVRVHAVSVLAPEVLPKSPLGGPIFIDAVGRTIGSGISRAALSGAGGQRVEIPITPLVEDLLRGKTPSGASPSATLALLSVNCFEETGTCIEPQSISFASFAGVGKPGEPYLRLILTVSDKVGLP